MKHPDITGYPAGEGYTCGYFERTMLLELLVHEPIKEPNRLPIIEIDIALNDDVCVGLQDYPERDVCPVVDKVKRRGHVMLFWDVFKDAASRPWEPNPVIGRLVCRDWEFRA